MERCFDLLIRADATPENGTGHVMRCLALAQGVARVTGCGVSFLSRLEGAGLGDMIRAVGCRLVELDCSHPDPEDLGRTLNALGGIRNPWLVLDGYHFDSAYQKAVRRAGHRLLVLDDVQERGQYHADIILNQNIGAEEFQYAADPDTLILAGVEYACLRPAFLQARPPVRLAPERAVRLLVTMGGADPTNATLDVVRGLAAEPVEGLRVQIVLGPANPHGEALAEAVRGSGMELVRGADMPALMAVADLAVTATGSTCWELAFMGVPMLGVILAENQAGIGRSLADSGVARTLGWARDLRPVDYARAVGGLAADVAARRTMIAAGQALVDGNGPGRIALAIQEKACVSH